MRNIMETRISRLENLLKAGTSVCMIAVKDESGIKWNGATHPDEAALSIAVSETVGERWPRPLVILDRGDFHEKRGAV